MNNTYTSWLPHWMQRGLCVLLTLLVAASTAQAQTSTAAPIITTPTTPGLFTGLPTYSGTAPAGSTVTVYVDGTSIGTTTAIGSSTSSGFGLPQPTSLTDGIHRVYATAQVSGQAVSANSNTNTFLVDATPPQVVSVTRQNPTINLTNATSLTFRVTFSESVTGALGGIPYRTTFNGATGGVIGGAAISGNVYDIMIGRVSGDGPIGLDVRPFNTNLGAGITDIAGNRLTSVFLTGETYIIDQTAPRVISLTTSIGNTTATSPIPFTATFSESVSALTASDITVSNGFVTNNSVSGSGIGPYTFSVTPSNNGQVSVLLAANAVQDPAGNGNQASETLNVVYSAPITSTNWTGTISTDWFTAGNWTTGVPTATLDVTILAGTIFGPAISRGTAATRNLTLGDGAVLNMSGGTLGVNADLTNNGTLQVTGGTVSFTGSAVTQQLRGTSPSAFATLLVNKASGKVQLGQNTSVSKLLTMSSGTLTTSAYFVQLGTTATLSETETSYVTGTVYTTRPLSAGSSESFGGLGLTLAPALGSTSPGYTLVGRTTGIALTGIGTSQSILRYFDIRPVVNENLDVQLDFSYFDHERNSIAATDVRLFKSTTGTKGPWLNQSPTTISGNTVTKTGVTDFSIWTVGSAANPLPVELIDFTAIAKGPEVTLAWHTASEVNSERFEIERSLDGSTFTKLSAVAAHGTTVATQAYLYRDALLPTNVLTLYYRLRQVDSDGMTHYSPVRIAVVTSTGLAVFPNPAHAGTTLLGAAANTTVQVLDRLGRVVLSTITDTTGNAKLALPAGLLPGMYVVRAAGQTTRLIVD